MHKVFVLLSGGVDSSTTLAIARQDFPGDKVECISINYGQRHKREMEAAAEIATHYNAKHSILDIAGALTGMLVDKGVLNEAVPDVSYTDLPHGISPTYVSFRNGTMLSILAAQAQSFVMAHSRKSVSDRGLSRSDKEEAEVTLYCGVHADDGVNWAYPDCTPEFIGSMANAIYIGTYNKVRLRAPLQYDNKAEVVRKGLKLNVPYELTWSCYKGGVEHCGTCPTCRSRKEAFAANVAEHRDVLYAE